MLLLRNIDPHDLKKRKSTTRGIQFQKSGGPGDQQKVFYFCFCICLNLVEGRGHNCPWPIWVSSTLNCYEMNFRLTNG